MLMDETPSEENNATGRDSLNRRGCWETRLEEIDAKRLSQRQVILGDSVRGD